MFFFTTTKTIHVGDREIRLVKSRLESHPLAATERGWKEPQPVLRSWKKWMIRWLD